MKLRLQRMLWLLAGWLCLLLALIGALLPVMLAVGTTIPGMNMPLYALSLCLTLGIMGILTPYATGPSPVYYGSGYIPAKDYDTDVTVTAVLPAPRGRTAATVGLVARGDLSHMEVAVAGRAPKPLHAMLVFDGRTDPSWSASIRSDELDLALLSPGV